MLPIIKDASACSSKKRARAVVLLNVLTVELGHEMRKQFGLVSQFQYVPPSPARARVRSALWAPRHSVRVLAPPVSQSDVKGRHDKFLAPCKDILRNQYRRQKRILVSDSFQNLTRTMVSCPEMSVSWNPAESVTP